MICKGVESWPYFSEEKNEQMRGKGEDANV